MSYDQVPNAQVAARTMDEQQALPRAVNLVVDDQLPRGIMADVHRQGRGDGCALFLPISPHA